MAANDDAEYYRFFVINIFTWGLPYNGDERITKEEAEKFGTYTLIRRDEKNRIAYVEDIIKGKCKFYITYTYHENGKLAYFEEVNCETGEKTKRTR